MVGSPQGSVWPSMLHGPSSCGVPPSTVTVAESSVPVLRRLMSTIAPLDQLGEDEEALPSREEAKAKPLAAARPRVESSDSEDEFWNLPPM